MKKIIKISIILVIIWILCIITRNIIKTKIYSSSVEEQAKQELQIGNVGVQIVENGNLIDDGKLIITEADEIKPGTVYNESIYAKNTGSIDCYVRVSLHKYFIDENGNKNQELSPDIIEIGEIGTNWIIDEEASTKERTVYYYKMPITLGEETSPIFRQLQISTEINNLYTASKNEDENGNYVIETTPKYSNQKIVLEVEFDVVQTHNAVDAIYSAWGRRVQIGSDGSLSLE